MHPVVVSHITNDQYAKLPLKSLTQIVNFMNEKEEVKEKRVWGDFLKTKDHSYIVRTRFCLEGFIPDSPEKSVKLYNGRKNDSREASNTTKKADEEYISFF